MQQIAFATLPTLWGWMGVIASPNGIRRLNLPVPSQDDALDKLKSEIEDAVYDPSPFEKLRLRLERYFMGGVVDFDDVLDLSKGSVFFQCAWKACVSIPRGETRNYAWLASQSGNPSAVRAAGQAMARNPACIIIPCHRVIGSDGSLRGFGGGLNLKQRMLDIERIPPT
jgi:methylated-DNA-[protein]-cysteine S-methyltransferase